MRAASPRLVWALSLGLFGACATTNVVLPEPLEEIEPVEIESLETGSPFELQAGSFRTRDLEKTKAGEPFSFTLEEGGIRRARINCIARVAFVCTGDEGFLFFLRIPSWPEGTAPEGGELSVETVVFQLRPSLGDPAPPDGPLLGFLIHGPDQVVGALQTRSPGAGIWLSPGQVASMRRAVAAAGFALRIHALLRTPAPPE